MSKILIPIPAKDFDPSEVSIPWQFLKAKGHSITFASPDGKIGKADPIMLTGRGLGILAPMLIAAPVAQDAYQALILDPAFQNPISYQNIDCDAYQAILLPGGHAQGMKTYLESDVLQEKVAQFFTSDKIVGAICHGVLLAARSKTKDGHSVLYGRKTTALPKWMELNAWALTALWLKNYYRTYPVSVQEEVSSLLRSKDDFLSGPLSLLRDEPDKLSRGFIVKDKNYISARWPGDAHLFAHEIHQSLL